VALALATSSSSYQQPVKYNLVVMREVFKHVGTVLGTYRMLCLRALGWLLKRGRAERGI